MEGRKLEIGPEGVDVMEEVELVVVGEGGRKIDY